MISLTTVNINCYKIVNYLCEYLNNFALDFLAFHDWLDNNIVTSLYPDVLPEFSRHRNNVLLSGGGDDFMKIVTARLHNSYDAL